MTPAFAAPDAAATPLHIIEETDLEAALAALPDAAANWLRRVGFTGALGQTHLVQAGDGELAVTGYGTPEKRARGRLHLASTARALPAGTYRLVGLDGQAAEEAALAWLLAAYSFDRYKSAPAQSANLIAPDSVDAARLEAIAAGECLTRDLINTPASDMGPAELEAAARGLAEEFDAQINVTTGDALLDTNFPMIHAVGRAAAPHRAPRLIDMAWGNTGPKLTLVGKGVCFDTGGLNLKPGSSMGLMKKDMGGSAAVLGLARMIMALKLPLRLRVLIPAVENSVSGDSFRPQDILTSRKGLTVEINNTDAEGRLVLADALALAAEDAPDLLISMATLTGAARVAVGHDLAPFFTTDPRMAAVLPEAAAKVADPVWQLPFWEPYEAMIEPGIADLDNAPKGGFGGAITAALFLRRFAEGTPSYTHFDIYGWQPTAAPGRPKGGVGQGTRALLQALPELLSL